MNKILFIAMASLFINGCTVREANPGSCPALPKMSVTASSLQSAALAQAGEAPVDCTKANTEAEAMACCTEKLSDAVGRQLCEAFVRTLLCHVTAETLK